MHIIYCSFDVEALSYTDAVFSVYLHQQSTIAARMLRGNPESALLLAPGREHRHMGTWGHSINRSRRAWRHPGDTHFQFLGESTHNNRPVQQHINQRLNNINVHRYYLVLGSSRPTRGRAPPDHNAGRPRGGPGPGAAAAAAARPPALITS
ncbi:hypothetical protein K1T71_011020 [Dendrolimus kikuchii]|uniref:Uncharacterized protein n=1 Tax=Dendrolimus kikuchii TaxID=765133 RepID=A0ACC1CQT1_9NEOP|nr:hypothetical protein K1T71_011020 [Dendrolimus kikuchii]